MKKVAALVIYKLVPDTMFASSVELRGEYFPTLYVPQNLKTLLLLEQDKNGVVFGR